MIGDENLTLLIGELLKKYGFKKNMSGTDVVMIISALGNNLSIILALSKIPPEQVIKYLNFIYSEYECLLKDKIDKK